MSGMIERPGNKRTPTAMCRNNVKRVCNAVGLSKMLKTNIVPIEKVSKFGFVKTREVTEGIPI